MLKRNDNGEAAAAFYAKRREWTDMLCELDKLSDRAFRVGFWLSRRMDSKEYCYYRHDQIGKALGMSVDKVARAIQELEDKSVLIVVRSHRKPNEYSIRFPYGFD